MTMKEFPLFRQLERHICSLPGFGKYSPAGSQIDFLSTIRAGERLVWLISIRSTYRDPALKKLEIWRFFSFSNNVSSSVEFDIPDKEDLESFALKMFLAVNFKLNFRIDVIDEIARIELNNQK